MVFFSEESTTAWKVLQNNETLNRYGRTLAKFLISLLRATFASSVDYKFPLDVDQKEKASELFDMAKQTRGFTDCIHSLCVLLFQARSGQKLSDRWSCPLICYLAVDNLKDDGSFNEAHHLTSYLAQWEYIIRGVALYEAFITSTDEDDILTSVHNIFNELTLTLN